MQQPRSYNTHSSFSSSFCLFVIIHVILGPITVWSNDAHQLFPLDLFVRLHQLNKHTRRSKLHHDLLWMCCQFAWPHGCAFWIKRPRERNATRTKRQQCIFFFFSFWDLLVWMCTCYMFLLGNTFLCNQVCLLCSSPGGRDDVQHGPPCLSATGQGASG